MNNIKTYKNLEIEADGWAKIDQHVVENRPPQRRTQPFIKGPINLQWIQRAAGVNATEVALWLCYKEAFVGAGKWVRVRPYNWINLASLEKDGTARSTHWRKPD